jgi:adiponectin receptor
MLLKKSDLPDWYAPMEFIETGYRRPQSALSTFYTIFQWHNETLNIYTHLLPGIWFLYELCNIPYQQYYIDSSIYAKFCIISGYSAFLSLLFTSSFAHAFYIVNKNCNSKCWCCDFIAIVIVNIGRVYVDIYLLSIVFLKNVPLFFLGIGLETLFALYAINQIIYKNAGGYWGIVYPLISSTTLLLPLSYISQKSDNYFIELHINPSLFREAVFHLFSCSVYVIIAGYVFFKGKVPERFYNKNGIFDYFNSHAWHHICIVLSIVSATKIAPLLHNM